MSKHDQSTTEETEKFVQYDINKNDIEVKIINKGDFQLEKPQSFNGLSKEEVLRYANDPKWVKIRWIFFILFWIIWLSMLVSAILLIVFTPKCPHKPTLDWWEKDCFYQIDVTKFKDINGDGVGDIEGVVSKLEYLDEKLGFKSLFLNQMLNSNVPKELNPTIGTIENLKSLRKVLKDRDMRFILDVPFGYLSKDTEFEKNSKEFLTHWLTEYADGIRFLNVNEKNGLNSATQAVIGTWLQVANEISRKTLRKKVLLFDSGNAKENRNKFESSNPTFYLNRDSISWFKNLNNPVTVNNQLSEYFTNSSNPRPNIMFNTYDAQSNSSLISDVILFLTYGTPIVLYGEEVGLIEGNPYMRWDDSVNCGFTSNASVKTNGDCKKSVEWGLAHGAGYTRIDFIHNLTQIRKSESFAFGKMLFTAQPLNKTNVLSFVRQADGFEGFLVAFHTKKTMESERVNFVERHKIPAKARVYIYASENQTNKHNEFVHDAPVSNDNIILKPASSSTLCLCTVPLVFQENNEDVHDSHLTLKRQKCNDLIRRYQNEYGCPGIVVGVSINGQNVYKKGFGLSDVENNAKAHEDTVMRIASISKPITTAIAAKLYENGVLDFDKSINEYVKTIPKFKWNDKDVIITSRQLMSHTSGIRHYDKNVNLETKETQSKAPLDTVYPEFYIKNHYKKVEDALELFINDRLLFEPGTNHLYTTHGFTMMSVVMEKASNKKFDELLSEFLKYFKMNRTYLDKNDPIIPGRSRFYTRDDAKKLKNVHYVDNSYKWAGGGLLSTVGDLLKFANHLLICYQTDEPTNFLKQETVRNFLWSKHSVINTKYKNDIEVVPLAKPIVDVGYGLGWCLCFDYKNKLKYVYHTGGALGAVSCLLIIPTDSTDKSINNIPDGITVAVFCNSSEANNITNLALNIAQIFENGQF